MLALAYHSITDRWFHPLAIRLASFRRQLHELAGRGYVGVTFAGAASAAVTGGERCVAVTFDDAFATVTDAWAVLDELGWPATVFVPTAAVENRVPMRWLVGDRRGTVDDPHLLPLGWDEIHDLRLAGWEVGSHSRTHRLLSTLDDASVEHELRESRLELERRFGSCTSVSYPFGEIDTRVVETARRTGYRWGSGLVAGAVTPMTIPRFAVGAADGPLRFALKTSDLTWRVRTTPAWKAVEALRRPR